MYDIKLYVLFNMVDLNFINQNINKSILNSFITDKIESENFILEKDLKNKFWQLKSKNEPMYNILSIDTVDMVTKFAKKLIDCDFNSILISGLGLGIIPYLCQEKTEIVDVVEIEDEVISIVNKLGHLKKNVRIFNEDINNFVPSIKYDIILFDHWMVSTTKKEIDLLNYKFSNFLNGTGFITVPVYEQCKKD